MEKNPTPVPTDSEVPETEQSPSGKEAEGSSP